MSKEPSDYAFLLSEYVKDQNRIRDLEREVSWLRLGIDNILEHASKRCSHAWDAHSDYICLVRTIHEGLK